MGELNSHGYATEDRIASALVVPMTITELESKTGISAGRLLAALKQMHGHGLVQCDRNDTTARVYWRKKHMSPVSGCGSIDIPAPGTRGLTKRNALPQAPAVPVAAEPVAVEAPVPAVVPAVAPEPAGPLPSKLVKPMRRPKSFQWIVRPHVPATTEISISCAHGFIDIRVENENPENEPDQVMIPVEHLDKTIQILQELQSLIRQEAQS